MKIKVLTDLNFWMRPEKSDHRFGHDLNLGPWSTVMKQLGGRHHYGCVSTLKVNQKYFNFESFTLTQKMTTLLELNKQEFITIYYYIFDEVIC